METFDLTEEHITLIRSMNVRWLQSETGAPAIDPKRPYGNSDVPRDMADLLGRTYDPEEGVSESDATALLALHRTTETALQLVLAFGSFAPGKYIRANAWSPWEPTP